MTTPPASPPAPWAALFDWDGVVIDSAAQHERSWELLAREERLPLPADHFLRGFGMKNEVIIAELLDWTRNPQEVRRLSLRKEALYREVIRTEGLSALPGVQPFLEDLLRRGIPAVIASSTHRENIETILGVLNFHHFFSGMVTAEDVSRGKPHPEVFLRAAAVARTDPSKCVVFEDAVHGLEAARAAGMYAVGLTTTHPAERLTLADLVVARLTDLDLDRFPPFLNSPLL